MSRNLLISQTTEVAKSLKSKPSVQKFIHPHYDAAYLFDIALNPAALPDRKLPHQVHSRKWRSRCQQSGRPE
jgi:hypothetical protein